MFEAMMFAKSRCKHGQCTKLIRSRPAEIVQIGKMRQAVPVARKPPRHPLSWKGGRNRLSDTPSAFLKLPHERKSTFRKLLCSHNRQFTTKDD